MDKYEVATMSKSGIPGEVLTFEYTHKCVPCQPTQPECGECEFAKPKTNADRIRSMSDEELAEWFYSGDLPWCNFEKDVVPCPYEEMPAPCEHCLLDWLKEEVTANDS